MKDFDLSVVICSWNTKEDLRECLRCLELEQNSLRLEVIVVENNSEDGSPDLVREEFPWVVLLRQPRNLGFTRGTNVGLDASRGAHALLLNSDAFVHPGALRALHDFAEANPGVGVLGPKLLNPDGSLQYSCRRFPNPVAALFRNTLVGRIFPNNRWTREYLMEDFNHAEVSQVDWVSGAALWITASARPTLPRLDPDFKMYCEDMDLCRRAWRANFGVAYVPFAVVTHKIGSATSLVPSRMIGRFHQSMFLYFRKHMLPDVPWPLRPIAFLAAAAAIGLRAALFLTKNRVDRVRQRWGR